LLKTKESCQNYGDTTVIAALNKKIPANPDSGRLGSCWWNYWQT